MRICYVSHADSYHTIKWATNLAKRGHEVHVATLRSWNEGDYRDTGIMVHHLLDSAEEGCVLGKVRYFAAVPRLRSLIEEIDPDVVHAHRVPSNGLICSIACRRPYYLSVWGEDIYSFPKKSPLHKAITKRSLSSCAWLLSTSRAMAQEVRRYVSKKVEITPFGVDMALFNPSKRKRADDDRFVIGTVKALEPRYGISTLLEGCAAFIRRHPGVDIEVRIAGRGSQEEELRALSQELGIGECVTWLGFIPQARAAQEWANFDVGVVVSESESFGVSAVECQASGTPLVITDIPGLMEACDGGAAARVIRRGDASGLADEIDALYENPAKREEMGRVGRKYVEREYEIEKCFDEIEDLYQAGLKRKGQHAD